MLLLSGFDVVILSWIKTLKLKPDLLLSPGLMLHPILSSDSDDNLTFLYITGGKIIRYKGLNAHQECR
jgi:hypothetical protein